MNKKEELEKDILITELTYLKNKKNSTYNDLDACYSVYQTYYGSNNLCLCSTPKYEKRYDKLYIKYIHDFMKNRSRLNNISYDAITEFFKNRHIVDEPYNDELDTSILMDLILDYYSNYDEKAYSFIKNFLNSNQLFYYEDEIYSGTSYNNRTLNKQYVLCRNITSIYDAGTLVHELGHVLYFKHMNEKRYEGFSSLNTLIEIPSCFHQYNFYEFCKQNGINVDRTLNSYYDMTLDNLLSLYVISSLSNYTINKDLSIDVDEKTFTKTLNGLLIIEGDEEKYLETKEDRYLINSIIYPIGRLLSIYMNFYYNNDIDKFNYIYKKIFNTTNNNIKFVLCEIEEGLNEKILTKYIK